MHFFFFSAFHFSLTTIFGAHIMFRVQEISIVTHAVRAPFLSRRLFRFKNHIYVCVLYAQRLC